jgi:hypothetical protein
LTTPDEEQFRRQILKEQRTRPAYKRMRRKLRVVLGSLALITALELVIFTAVNLQENLYIPLWFLTAIIPWTLGLGVWIRPEQKELKEWRRSRVESSPTKRG